ncbi:hypothetical protein [Acetobacter musti]|nr:hypothetical protein [Acetobacter musti]
MAETMLSVTVCVPPDRMVPEVAAVPDVPHSKTVCVPPFPMVKWLSVPP